MCIRNFYILPSHIFPLVVGDVEMEDRHLYNRYLKMNDPIFRNGKRAYYKSIDGEIEENKPMEFEHGITEDLLKGVTKKDPVTGIVNLYESIDKLLENASFLGMSHQQLDEYMRLFVRINIAEGYYVIRRLEGKELFERILNLYKDCPQLCSPQ